METAALGPPPETPEYGLLTLEELDNLPEPELEWYAPYWVPVGTKTVLCAYPKTGKTILLFHILKSILNGEEFCGGKCTPAKVVYLSEQTQFEFKKQIEEVPGLTGHPNFSVLLAERQDPMISSWAQTLHWADDEMKKRDAKILVVDTFLSYAKLPEDGENDSATIQKALNEMNFLFKDPYRSVVVLHHTCKPSKDKRGETLDPLAIEAVRGSGGFVGGAGHIALMHGKPKSTVRNFTFYGRHLHGASMEMVLDKNKSLYHMTSYSR